jgi:hypothetical protein
MSRLIADLLGQPERLVGKTIMKLEAKNGYPSHDARHLAENIQQVRRKLADLSLDPDDTTAEELYHSLQARFQRDSQAFDIENNFHSLDFESKAEKAKHIIQSGTALPQRWMLKTTAAKNILRRQPPKKLMKRLSYRSVESLLKRENTGRLFIEANAVESAAWRKQLSRSISRLDSTAFELREISIFVLNMDIGSSPLVYNDDIGALAIAKTGLTDSMRLLGLVVLLSDFMESLSDKPVELSSDVLQWWNEMDGLVAYPDGRAVSMNLKDTSINLANRQEFLDRVLSAGRIGFWKNLISRYENQLEIEEDMLAGLSEAVMPRAPLRQPAFEYAENF